MTNTDKIRDKIIKLLALSKSPNPAEAESASRKAQELMLKYNIEILEQEVQDYIEDNLFTIKGKTDYFKNKISIILQEYYFVKVIISTEFSNVTSYRRYDYWGEPETVWRRNKKKTYKILGEKLNIEIAKKMFRFFLDQGEYFWWRHKVDNNLRKPARRTRDSFLVGFMVGVEQQLRDQVDSKEEYGLVLSKSDFKLEEFLEKLHGALKEVQGKKLDIDPEAYFEGKEKGEVLNINKADKSPEESEAVVTDLMIGN